MEVWKPVLNYEGLYEVSSFGSVRSVPRSVPYVRAGKQRVANYKGRVLTAFHNSKASPPYDYVNLCKAGVCEKTAVHILVCTTFNGSRPEGAIIRHLDGNTFNNDASNLSWGSLKENYEDMARHGRARWGTKAYTAKMDEEKVRFIRSQRGKVNGAKLATQLGIHRNNLYKIWRGEIWRHVI